MTFDENTTFENSFNDSDIVASTEEVLAISEMLIEENIEEYEVLAK